MWKDILKAVLSVLIPFLYAAIIAKYPNFPLTGAQFLALVLWIIGLFIGGWNASKAYRHHKMRKT